MQHQMHSSDNISRMAPISSSIQITKFNQFCDTKRNFCYSERDFPTDESGSWKYQFKISGRPLSNTSPRRFVVERYPIYCEHTVDLSHVRGDPEAIDLRKSICEVTGRVLFQSEGFPPLVQRLPSCRPVFKSYLAYHQN